MLEKIKRYYYRRKAKRGLLKKYLLNVACNNLLKEFISASIIERKQEFRRKELVEKQAEIKEEELFIKWLKAKK